MNLVAIFLCLVVLAIFLLSYWVKTVHPWARGVIAGTRCASGRQLVQGCTGEVFMGARGASKGASLSAGAHSNERKLVAMRL